MDAKLFTDKAQRIARTIIDSYGKDPYEYDDLEREIVGAFLFGAVFSFSTEQGGNEMRWQNEVPFQAAMVNIFYRELHVALDQCRGMYEFYLACTQKDYHPLINQIIHQGVEGYFSLDRPELYKISLDHSIGKIREAMRKEGYST